MSSVWALDQVGRGRIAHRITVKALALGEKWVTKAWDKIVGKDMSIVWKYIYRLVF